MFKKSNLSPFVLISGLMFMAMVLSACQPAATPAPTTAAAAPTTAAAAPTTAPAATSTKLVVASFYPLDQVSGWDGMLAKFKQDHPGVEVEVQVTPFDQYMPKLLTQIAGGDAPDVVGVENTPFPQFVQENMLLDLNPLLAKTEGFSTKDFFPNLLDRYTYNGEVYGIPYDAQPFAMLFYNPKLFDEAGVAYPTDQWTWNDARDAAKKLTKIDASGAVTQYGLVIPFTGSPTGETTMIYAWNGRYVDDLRNPTKSMLDQQAAIDGVQFLVDMMYKDKSVITPATLESLGGTADVDMFTSGKVAMMYGGFWSAVENPVGFNKIGAKVVMGPTGPDGNRLYATGGTAYSILKSSKNQELAWEFIQYFLGQVGYQEAFRASTLGAMYPPAHIPSFNWYLTQKVGYIDTIQPDEDALKYVIFAPYALNWQEISDKCITPDMSLVLQNLKPVAETMKGMSTCVNGMLNK